MYFYLSTYICFNGDCTCSSISAEVTLYYFFCPWVHEPDKSAA